MDMTTPSTQHVLQVYEVTLAQPLVGKAADAAVRKFASGSLLLVGDHSPLLPARLQMTGERSARVAVCEGRYHQVGTCSGTAYAWVHFTCPVRSACAEHANSLVILPDQCTAS